jgi:hypothetical protein
MRRESEPVYTRRSFVEQVRFLGRAGAIIALFTDAAIGSPDLGQFQGFIRQALARVK